MVGQIKNQEGRGSDFGVNLPKYDMLKIGENPILLLQLEFGVHNSSIDYLVKQHCVRKPGGWKRACRIRISDARDEIRASFDADGG